MVLTSIYSTADIATISSISYLFRSTGGVIGVSLVSTVFQGKLKEYLEQTITGPDAKEVSESIDLSCYNKMKFNHALTPPLCLIL
jgi:hypothetical protein